MINATPGDPLANSFATVANADQYHAGRLHNAAWVEAKATDKERALIWASRQISKLQFRGVIANEAQSLSWPRINTYDHNGRANSSATIPQSIIDATSEFAFLLIEADTSKGSDMKGIKRVKIENLEIEADDTTAPGEIPDSVLSMLAGYITGNSSGGSVSLVRV